MIKFRQMDPRYFASQKQQATISSNFRITLKSYLLYVFKITKKTMESSTCIQPIDTNNP